MTTSRTERPSDAHTSWMNRVGRQRDATPDRLVSCTTRSACLPTSIDPSRSAIPIAAAPPIVASSKASWAPNTGRVDAKCPWPDRRRAPRRAARSTASPAFSASQPSPTRDAPAPHLDMATGAGDAPDRGAGRPRGSRRPRSSVRPSTRRSRRRRGARRGRSARGDRGHRGGRGGRPGAVPCAPGTTRVAPRSVTGGRSARTSRVAGQVGGPGRRARRVMQVVTDEGDPSRSTSAARPGSGQSIGSGGRGPRRSVR